MKNRFAYMGAGLVLMSGVALADADADKDLTNPSTTGTEAMEQSPSQVDDAGSGDSAGRSVGVPESGLGTMGTGNRGTTGGMGATTGTESMNEDLKDTEQNKE